MQLLVEDALISNLALDTRHNASLQDLVRGGLPLVHALYLVLVVVQVVVERVHQRLQGAILNSVLLVVLHDVIRLNFEFQKVVGNVLSIFYLARGHAFGLVFPFSLFGLLPFLFHLCYLLRRHGGRPKRRRKLCTCVPRRRLRDAKGIGGQIASALRVGQQRRYILAVL